MTVTPLDMALAYATKRGWAVFPVEPGGKAPIGSLAPHGLKDATTDPGLIKRWWAKVPGANIGLPTGIHFDVLDVDGFTGWRSLTQLTAEHGALPSSPVVLTPRDGAHFYFKQTGAGNRAGIRPNLDWRGAGGYVVAPPSAGANGKRYEWIIPPAERTLEPVALPAPAESPSGFSVAPATAPTGRYGRRALEAEAGRVAVAPEGSRNHQLNRSAFALGQLVAGGELTLDETWAALEAAAIRSGLTSREIEKTIASGMAAGRNEPRWAP